jgi:heme oxygenase
MRAATADLHDELDRAFAVFDLAEPAGFDAFLRVHQSAMAAIAPAFEAFVRGPLAMAAPDYPAMLAADLDRPAPTAGGVELDGVGAAYVVAGSRLGRSVLRKRGFARPSRYMDDRAGLAVWRALLAWMEIQPETPAQRIRAEASAREGFGIFARALAAETLHCPA